MLLPGIRTCRIEELDLSDTSILTVTVAWRAIGVMGRRSEQGAPAKHRKI